MTDLLNTNAHERICPSCRSKVPAILDRCSCGAFLGVAETPAADGLVTQAEALYESYLNARMQRATKALQSARIALASKPTDARLIHQMREATREIEALRTQIATQSQRTEEARQRDGAGKQRVEPAAQSTPEEAFRAAQAAQAEQALKAAIEAKRNSESVKAANDDSAFNAAQAARAERVATMDLCPVCRASMSPDGRCRACGYARRPTANSNSEEFLSKEEIAALMRPLARG